MNRFLSRLAEYDLALWAPEFRELLRSRETFIRERDTKGRAYIRALDSLPDMPPSSIDLSTDQIRIGTTKDGSPVQRQELHDVLTSLHPWRKGPFSLFGIDIDTEWVSSLKWNRLVPHIARLTGRRILDIGSSSGYYMFRMADHDPALVLGVEPYLAYVFQFETLNRYARIRDLYTLPVTFEDLPDLTGQFDTVFSMGILYHRRSPVDSLIDIRRKLRRGGELVLETLIIRGEDHLALCPEDRYAKMRNVHFIPTLATLRSWMHKAGFTNVRCIDVSPTTQNEQRSTEWMRFESLKDFLDPTDSGKTVEGHPAPIRAVILGERK
ncbi:MAG TPA: tRNA 5-methoxyuridine(34)/uridine 5-oxyacetic acid(34) synthase CmoB [Desulfomicrobiaceae bacterium]|nr:tRNA 5-methoxyuridine(34)/uridine 5-oxyacetic acid(34) synthase CmoB [Desulfomicrobiaceae bacterium]